MFRLKFKLKNSQPYLRLASNEVYTVFPCEDADWQSFG